MYNHKIYIVIPNYEGRDHLEYSIPSFLNSTYQNSHIVVVDGSTDGSVEFLNKHYSRVHTIEHKLENTFASKVNVGIKYAIENGADYVAICNNDILVLPNWIEHTVDALTKNSNVGIVGNTEMSREEKDEFLKINYKSLTYESKEVKSVNGACYICDINIFNTMGYFDEFYHMYAEETDLFLRARKAGYKIIKTNTKYWHYGEASGWGGEPVLYISWLNYRNAIRCAIKNDSIVNLCLVFLSILNQASNPFINKDRIKKIRKRMRPYNIFFNGVIYMHSILWNIIYLPLTIKARLIENKKAEIHIQNKSTNDLK
jgi:GT2 family glycosyltransferase